MPILNYTTKVAPAKTAMEIQMILSRHAEAVMTEYANGKPMAVRFLLTVAGQKVNYRLPCNVDGVLKALQRDRVAFSYRNPEQAERVAWRIVKDWIEAQIALIDAKQATIAEVFLPYATAPNGETMFQMFEKQVARGLLTAGTPPAEEESE